MEQLCEFLEWDSRFFGVRIARVHGNSLDQQRVAAIDSWCQTASLDCLYFLSRCDDALTTRLAEEHGFHWVDVRISLILDRLDPAHEQEGHAPGSAVPIRLATGTDIAALREIARRSYSHSRFYYDEHFPRELCGEFYAVWIEKCCHGHANAVLVAEIQGSPVGYVTCRLGHDEKIGQIDLVAVIEAAAGRGVGFSLLNAAKRWFSAHGATQVVVVTQGRNIGAQRLYQRSGFVTNRVELWYHRWFSHGS